MTARKKRVEFSHRVAEGVIALTVILFIFTLYIVWKTNDTSPLMYLIPSVIGLSATVLGFYLKKAEKENVKKIEQNYIPQYEYMTDYEREAAINENSRRTG